MDEVFEKLAALFALREYVFEPADAGAARAMAAQQAGLYENLIDAFSSPMYNDGNRAGGTLAPALAQRVFAWALGIVRTTPAKVENNSGRFSIASFFPILDDRATHELIGYVRRPETASRSQATTEHFPMALAGALVAEGPEFSVLPDEGERSLSIFDGVSLSRNIAKYASAQAAQAQATKIKFDADREIEQFSRAIDVAGGNFDKRHQKQMRELESITAMGLDMQGRVQAFDAEIRASKERLENYELTVREELKLDRARLNWETRFKEARVGFGIAVGLLALYLFGTIWVATAYGLPIVRALANIEQVAAATAQSVAPPSQPPSATPPAVVTPGDSVAIAVIHQFGRLIVFSVPVFVYLWVLRVVVRYFMRSMLLMDDARQRHTMLDTYFLLSQSGRADERDRPLVLWALFRQTPGHGPDGIEPPDFTEVIKAGLERARP